ncbi:MAG: N-acetyl-gamma-glutamyl-phosphate reductase [Cyclobacteriaceae bacterium]
MVKVGIVGGAGYTGGELLRILVGHTKSAIVFVNSNSNAGNQIYDVHQDLIGYTDLKFTDQLPYELIDVLFLCVGHGDAIPFLEKNPVPDQIKIIDLSQDFRHKRAGNDFVYGLPELNREEIKESSRIANPGCFATTIQLGLLPLAKNKSLTEEIHVSAVTGSTGAGQKLAPTSHFSWRNNNMSIYKAFEHQHLKEIGQSLEQLQGVFDQKINFIPFRGDFTRGIIASTYLTSDLSEKEATGLYSNYYKDHPFVQVVGKNPHLKQVVNTNNVLVYVKKYDDKLHIISMSDNLIKGASGQAVQNMNLIFGLDENEGLRLKPVGF